MIHPRPRLRLPLAFDAERMCAETASIGEAEWVRHFNTDEHDGGWSGIALVAPHGNASTIYANTTDPAAVSATPILDRSPYLREVLAAFRCPIVAARLLRLAPGGRIHEHRDYNLGPDHGLVRVHVPIATGDAVRFVVDGRRVKMAPGEAWYLDFAQPHRVDNDGGVDRLHLVVDCTLDAWMTEVLRSADATEPPEDTTPDPRTPLDSLRVALAIDSTLGVALQTETDREAFVTAIDALAQVRGARLRRDDLAQALRAGSRRGPPLEVDAPLGTGWLPDAVEWRDSGARVRWSWFGVQRLVEPFFDDALAIARRSPYGQFVRPATSLDVLERLAIERPGLPLRGIIAHVSRCGSTLVSQLLASVPDLVVASEPPALDGVMRGGTADRATRIRWMRAMVSALAQPRTGRETGFVVKLDSWHLASIALVRDAFPGVPIAILYRDPADVLASQMRAPGLQMVGGMAGEPFAGVPLGGDQLAYRARMVGLLFEAALAASSGTRLVAYPELPGAAASMIAPHFGIAHDAFDLERTSEIGRRDAKSPTQEFTPRAEPSAEVAAAAERHAGAAFRALELERRAQAT